jgi:hypothetical protein
MDRARLEKARQHVADAVLSIFYYAQALPISGYYVTTRGGVDFVTYHVPGSDRVKFFLPPSAFEELVAPTVSEYGRTIYTPATDEEWAALIGHLPQLLL